MGRQRREQLLLLAPVQRVRLPLIGVEQQLDLRCCRELGQSVFIQPLALCEVQDSSNDFKPVVNGSGGYSLFPSVFDPQLHCPDVDSIQRNRPYPGHQPSQLRDVTSNRALVLVLANKLRRR